MVARKGTEPLMNSECGNVWGYEGSTGDVDWSWDYHIMMNAFRRHPQVCGWLYTEHHDVINEWNGYWRFDRSQKFTGMDALVPGMSLNDLHGDFYVALSEEMCQEVKSGAEVTVPVYVSCLADRAVGDTLQLRGTVRGWDSQGRERTYGRFRRNVPYTAWKCGPLEPVEVTMPRAPRRHRPGRATAGSIRNRPGQKLHHVCRPRRSANPREEMIAQRGQNIRVIRVRPQDFAKAEWSVKQWNVLRRTQGQRRRGRVLRVSHRLAGRTQGC